MLVGERMSTPVITVHPGVPMQEALGLMRKEHIRRLPVIDKRSHQLVGIVSEQDLLHASPSDVTSLSIWEMNYLLCKITVADVMCSEVTTIAEDTLLEEAARIMVDNKIGGLPVMRGDRVVGIITETDLFKIFLELLGAREPGVRIGALIPSTPGVLAGLTRAIFEVGGDILALGTFLGESSSNREICFKVAGVDARSLENAIHPYIEQIIDIREPQWA
ncbi:MAG: CBS domain-containing protein [Anaerolineales bacterium]|nr:CBS domain-containing protein [Anaerolineales bacterium]